MILSRNQRILVGLGFSHDIHCVNSARLSRSLRPDEFCREAADVRFFTVVTHTLYSVPMLMPSAGRFVPFAANSRRGPPAPGKSPRHSVLIRTRARPPAFPPPACNP